jgi:hypothetical protein
MILHSLEYSELPFATNNLMCEPSHTTVTTMRWSLHRIGLVNFALVLSIMIASNLRPLSRRAASVVAFPQLSVSRFGTAAPHQRRRPSTANQQHQPRTHTWKSPILSSSSVGETKQQSWSRDQQSQPSSVEPQRQPPRLYKRTRLFGKQKDAVGDPDANRLYRADRVLANRTGKSRKECFQLLQEGRVFRVITTASNDQHDDKTVSATEAVTLNSSSSSLSMQDSKGRVDWLPSRPGRTILPLLEAVRGPSAKLAMHAELRIDKHQIVPLPPPLLAVYYKPKVRA